MSSSFHSSISLWLQTDEGGLHTLVAGTLWYLLIVYGIDKRFYYLWGRFKVSPRPLKSCNFLFEDGVVGNFSLVSEFGLPYGNIECRYICNLFLYKCRYLSGSFYFFRD